MNGTNIKGWKRIRQTGLWTILSTLSVLSSLQGIRAQTIPQAVNDELTRIQQGYQQTPYLSFNVSYTYALEGQPSVHLDSLSGSYTLNGNRYYGSLGQIQYLQDSLYNLTVYSAEKLVSMAKVGASGGKRINLFAGWDSVLLANNVTAATLQDDTADKDNGVIRFSFGGGVPYQRSAIHFNKSTHRINSVTYWTAQPAIGSVTDTTTQETSSKVVVRIIFSNYRTGVVKDDLFDHTRFVRKENDIWKLQDPYKGYKLFLSSAGL
jgi:hypothetical protein